MTQLLLSHQHQQYNPQRAPQRAPQGVPLYHPIQIQLQYPPNHPPGNPPQNPPCAPRTTPTQRPTLRPTTGRTPRPTRRPVAWNDGTSVWKQVGQDIQGENAQDYFGWSVALSQDGTTIASGAYSNGDAGTRAGQVRVFRLTGDDNRWTQWGSTLLGESAWDQFGWSVALSAGGTILAVGANWNDNLSGRDAGQVRIYQYAAGNWRQLGSTIQGEAAGDWFGHSLALSADGLTVAAGGALSDGNGDRSGHVRVFRYNTRSQEWFAKGRTILGSASGDYFGNAVDLSADGNVLVAGAYFWNGGRGSNWGQVRVFQYNSLLNTWQQLGQELHGEASGDQFGYSVSISADGSAVAAGAYWNDGNGDRSGHVRVFRYNPDDLRWQQRGQNLNGQAAGDRFGGSVSLSEDGNVVACGAYWNDGGVGRANVGYVRVYGYDGASRLWSQRGRNLEGENEYDQFGYSVSLAADGTTVAAGAIFSDVGDLKNAGHVRVYRAHDP